MLWARRQLRYLNMWRAGRATGAESTGRAHEAMAGKSNHAKACNCLSPTATAQSNNLATFDARFATRRGSSRVVRLWTWSQQTPRGSMTKRNRGRSPVLGAGSSGQWLSSLSTTSSPRPRVLQIATWQGQARLSMSEPLAVRRRRNTYPATKSSCKVWGAAETAQVGDVGDRCLTALEAITSRVNP